MPSYPTSVFAPSAKSAGQTIQHTHVNDLQDEVVAIESGLRTGTAPLNSSGSTVATLSVTGGSTFASRPVMPPPDSARAQLDAIQEIASGSSVGVSWTNTLFETNSSLHSTGTNPDRLTPQSTGVYLFMTSLLIRTGASLEVSIKDSSGLTLARSYSSGLAHAVTTIKRFDEVGGYCRVQVNSVGSTNGISTGFSNFGMAKL